MSDQTLIHDTDETVMHAIYRAFAVIPWVWVTLFAFYVMAAAVKVGGLPSYGQPDPKDLTALNWLMVPIYLLIPTTFGSLPVWLAMVAWRRDAIPETRERRATLLCYLIGMTIMVSIVFLDPLGLMTWFVD